MKRVSLIILIFTALAALLQACASAVPTPVPSPAPTENLLRGGVLATFLVNDQQFKVWTTNPQTIRQLIDLEAGKSTSSIPNGKILRGAGVANYNAPWFWHLDPQDTEMADMTTEVCDAEPNYVQENIDEFVNVVGRYCPWDASLLSLIDYR